jgi:predicted nucleic acid-binding protein
MKADVFLDSNVILYAAADVKQEGAKKEAALRLIVDTDFGTSVQVLGEFYDNARRKAKLGIPAQRMKELLRLLKARPLVEETVELFDRAVAIAERHGLRYYDAAILAAAEELGAATLYSEDFSDGQEYDGVKVINPFRGLD